MSSELSRTDPAERTRAARILERLRAAADPGGFVPFDRFMEVALYDPEAGYYTASRSPLGPRGDFYTAAHVTPLFAKALAQHVRSIRAALGPPSVFRIVELGPGDGTLAAGLVSALRADPDGIEYCLIERSGPRSDEAIARIRDRTPDASVRRLDSVGAEGPFTGVVIANEFLDAQPTRRLLWDGTRWRELGIAVRAAGIAPAESDATRPVPEPPLPAAPEPGTVLEVSPAAEGVVREIGDHLERGAAILIDYGAEEGELLLGHPHGTLATVRGHRSLDSPLEAPGTSDLSMFVNFTRVRAAARRAGLTEVSFQSQAEALGTWGFPQLLDGALRSAGSSEAEVRLRLAAKNLLFGFENFRVLEVAPSGPPPT
jgi:SAM-dependent MidA family methyltransferase